MSDTDQQMLDQVYDNHIHQNLEVSIYMEGELLMIPFGKNTGAIS
jgi:hypothetical protein